ncbi:unnamed protein product [Anisakis simplex]|uniref:CHAT domain-containing protein n=1 Tax=Anisakis simplex TaxID=6269 RepID=A0A0M3JX95_ANISI|nr:unnamed protein product [Anisakis simplex]
MYHALGYSAVVCVRAIMTCDRHDLERAMQVSKDTTAVIDTFRAKFSIAESLHRLSGQMKTLTDQVVGFSGDLRKQLQTVGISESMNGTLRATLCSMVLLSWHLLADFVVGSANADINICKQLSSSLINSYPESKCVYTYLVTILINTQLNSAGITETVENLLRRVPELRIRIAGKLLPVEKFCAIKSNRFLRNGSTFLAHYEFLYFWNGFTIISTNSMLMESTLKDIDAIWQRLKEDNGLLFCEKNLNDHSYLVPYALFELAQLRTDEGKNEDAKKLLKRARTYRGYLLETRLNFRIRSVSGTLGVRHR